MDNMQSNDQTEALDDQQGHVADQSRRNFLKAAVVASAAVAVAGGAAGFAIANGKAPSQFLSFVGFVASGSCIPIKQGGKFGGSNPNNFIQVDSSYLDNFGTASTTKDGTGNYPLTFTRCGNTGIITFTLTDKNDTSKSITGTFVESGGDGGTASYQSGTNGVLYLAYINVSGSTSTEYPTGSCLTLSC
jgi:hypothetical protein